MLTDTGTGTDGTVIFALVVFQFGSVTLPIWPEF
jgi:hypothetical protein